MASIEKINKFCLNEINKFTACECSLDVSDVDTYSLIPNNYSYAETSKDMQGRDITVVSLKNSSCFVAFNITYVKNSPRKDSYGIKDISLQFYTKDEAVAKAEWMNYDYHSDADTTHPQPHWHLAPKIVLIGESKEDTKDNETFEQALTKATLDQALEQRTFEVIANQLDVQEKNNLDSIHYTMCGRWVEKTDDGRSVYELTEDNLKRWLPQCLEAMIHQFESLVSTKNFGHVQIG